jgi:hypothetical protein
VSLLVNVGRGMLARWAGYAFEKDQLAGRGSQECLTSRRRLAGTWLNTCKVCLGSLAQKGPGVQGR